MRIAFIGHLCVDRNVIHREEHVLYGGGVLHGSVTAARLGAEVFLFTRCAPGDREGFRALGEAGVHVEFLPGEASTSIRNEYPTDNPDDRTSSLLSRAAPFAEADLQGIEADVLHVNPLSMGEFPPDLLPAARRRARVLCGDAQGFLRVVEPDGRLAHRDWDDRRRHLPLLDVFKVDLKEAAILTAVEEPRRAAQAIQQMGAATVLLTHRGGVCVVDGSGCYEAPFTGGTLEGRTGRGDTCTAAFLVGRERLGPLEATRFAARITSEKMQYRGPYRGSGGVAGSREGLREGGERG